MNYLHILKTIRKSRGRALVALIVLCILLGGSGAALAVGGLSGAGRLGPAADPVPHGVLEIEPFFNAFRARGRFNEAGNRKNIPDDYDRLIATGEPRRSESTTVMGFRVTAGFFQDFEGGVAYGHATSENNIDNTTSSRFNSLASGVKYLINPQHDFRFAVQAGVNMETASATTDHEVGLINTWQITDSLALDADVVYRFSSKRTIDDQKVIQRGMAYNVGLGYLLTDILQAVMKLGYAESYTRRLRDYVVPEYPELTINANQILGLPATTDLLVPGLGTFPRTTPNVQERVRVWERKLTANAGFTYRLNSDALVVLVYSQDLTGVNSLAGQTISAGFAFAIGGEPSTPTAEEE